MLGIHTTVHIDNETDCETFLAMCRVTDATPNEMATRIVAKAITAQSDDPKVAESVRINRKLEATR